MPTILSHDPHISIELRDPSRQLPLWRYVYGGKPKPFFHPLCTPAGHLLTHFEPADHIWHRGLWFAIKFINGENFWEEKEGELWGTQKTPSPPKVAKESQDRIVVSSGLEWCRPNNAGVVIHERRQFIHQPIDDSVYAIDFSTTLTPTIDLILDRTPYTTWGGYSGLTFRGAPGWHDTRLLFSDGSTNDRPLGIRHNWCDLSGNFDSQNATGGIAIFDHPQNPRHPTPWYGGTGPNHYFNAAFLFHEPMEVKKDQPVGFQYRVLVHDGIPGRAELQKRYEDYVNGTQVRC